MKIRPLYLALVLASLHVAASAQLIKCKQADGRYTFQDTPCGAPAGAQERKIPKPGDKDPNFLKQTRSDKPGANWGPHVAIPPAPPLNAPQPGAQVQARVTRAQPETASSYPQPRGAYAPAAVQRENERVMAENEITRERNRTGRCTSARQQLGVLKDRSPVYSRDNNGNKVYVQNDNRAGEIGRAEQEVQDACN